MYRGLYAYYIDAKAKTGGLTVKQVAVRGNSEQDAIRQYEEQHPDMMVIKIYSK